MGQEKEFSRPDERIETRLSLTADRLEAFVSEASRRGGRYKTGRCKNHKCWREAIRFVAVSQEGAGAFLNAIPMRDDMNNEDGDVGDARSGGRGDLTGTPPRPGSGRWSVRVGIPTYF